MSDTVKLQLKHNGQVRAFEFSKKRKTSPTTNDDPHAKRPRVETKAVDGDVIMIKDVKHDIAQAFGLTADKIKIAGLKVTTTSPTSGKSFAKEADDNTPLTSLTVRTGLVLGASKPVATSGSTETGTSSEDDALIAEIWAAEERREFDRLVERYGNKKTSGSDKLMVAAFCLDLHACQSIVRDMNPVMIGVNSTAYLLAESAYLAGVNNRMDVMMWFVRSSAKTFATVGVEAPSIPRLVARLCRWSGRKHIISALLAEMGELNSTSFASIDATRPLELGALEAAKWLASHGAEVTWLNRHVWAPTARSREFHPAALAPGLEWALERLQTTVMDKNQAVDAAAWIVEFVINVVVEKSALPDHDILDRRLKRSIDRVCGHLYGFAQRIADADKKSRLEAEAVASDVTQTTEARNEARQMLEQSVPATVQDMRECVARVVLDKLMNIRSYHFGRDSVVFSDATMAMLSSILQRFRSDMAYQYPVLATSFGPGGLHPISTLMRHAVLDQHQGLLQLAMLALDETRRQRAEEGIARLDRGGDLHDPDALTLSPLHETFFDSKMDRALDIRRPRHPDYREDGAWYYSTLEERKTAIRLSSIAEFAMRINTMPEPEKVVSDCVFAMADAWRMRSATTPDVARAALFRLLQLGATLSLRKSVVPAILRTSLDGALTDHETYENVGDFFAKNVWLRAYVTLPPPVIRTVLAYAMPNLRGLTALEVQHKVIREQ